MLLLAQELDREDCRREEVSQNTREMPDIGRKKKKERDERKGVIRNHGPGKETVVVSNDGCLTNSTKTPSIISVCTVCGLMNNASGFGCRIALGVRER
jgi:hypothetical protein